MEVDFGGILWNDFKQYVLAKKAEVPSARFWSVVLNKIFADHATIVPEDDDPMYKPSSISRLSTNPNCPPSIRRIPLHLLQSVGMNKTVVKNYRRSYTDLFPAIADFGVIIADPTASAEHASEDEEDPEVSPLQRKPKSVTLKSPTKSHSTRGIKCST